MISRKESLTFFIIESSEAVYRRSVEDKYKVTCSNGDSSWTKECGGTISCGRLVAKCLDEGGCAEVCRTRMVYVPQVRTFYLLEEDLGER